MHCIGIGMRWQWMAGDGGGDRQHSDNSESIPIRSVCEWLIAQTLRRRDKHTVGAQVVKTIDRLQSGGVEYALNNASLQQSSGIDRLCRLMASIASNASLQRWLHSETPSARDIRSLWVWWVWLWTPLPSMPCIIDSQTKALHSDTRTQSLADNRFGNNFLKSNYILANCLMEGIWRSQSPFRRSRVWILNHFGNKLS